MRDSRPPTFLSEAEMGQSLSSGWSDPKLQLWITVEVRNISLASLSPALQEPPMRKKPRPPSPRRPPVTILSSDLLHRPNPTAEVAQLFPLEAIIKVKNYFYYNPALLTQSFLKNSPFALIFSMP